MPRPSRRRRLTLALLCAALWLPGIAAAAGHPSCCPEMRATRDAAPCHGDAPAPCESVNATPCCDVAPAGALPAAAQRECSHTAASSLLPAHHVVPASLLASALPAVPLSLHAPPARLSVVLRN
jgi:hypothetical protein